MEIARNSRVFLKCDLDAGSRNTFMHLMNKTSKKCLHFSPSKQYSSGDITTLFLALFHYPVDAQPNVIFLFLP